MKSNILARQNINVTEVLYSLRIRLNTGNTLSPLTAKIESV